MAGSGSSGSGSSGSSASGKTKPAMLGYGRQYVDDDDIAAVTAVLRADYLTSGPVLARFEAAMAERVGARHAVACANGTAALHIACLAAGLKPGRAGLTQALTFVASANAMLYCGAGALLGDVDRETLTLSPATIAKALAAAQADTVDVVMPVHFAGLAVSSGAIRAAAGKRIVIEDACHAFGGAYEDGRPVGCGAYADMSVFSFHPVKPFTTAEGGAVTTNDDGLAKRLRAYREHGIERAGAGFVDHEQAHEAGEPAPWYYEQQVLGFNYRLTEIQAALGLSQLAKLDRFTRRRCEIALHYDAAFARLPHVSLPQSRPEERRRSALHLYCIHVDFAALATTRTRFMKRLAERGIGSQVHYVPVYRQPYHAARAAFDPAAFPATEHHYSQCLSIPLHPGLTDEDAARVVAAVTEVVTGDRGAA